MPTAPFRVNQPSEPEDPSQVSSQTTGVHSIARLGGRKPPVREVGQIDQYSGIGPLTQLSDTSLDLNSSNDRLLNARQVADRLGVSERFIRDHTTRRSPKIRAVKIGKLIRYRRTDIDLFMNELGTLPSSRRPQFGV